jgi:hypothetical protein
VVRASVVRSAYFGEIDAPGARDGEYFHRATPTWVARAMEALTGRSRSHAHDRLASLFQSRLRVALANLNCSLWPARDAFDAGSSPIPAGLKARCEAMWAHFMKGSYGICVAHPISEQAIVRKQLLMEKLMALTANGSRREFAPDEANEVADTMASYTAACMPFSPLEYPMSTSKRLIDDLKLPQFRLRTRGGVPQRQ